ncbi:hypothetical protein ZIOFF_025371 [Zingiber officinale]|uniref:Uncharacterized protein n=1 Tax=Zingiber officinale TaxID=94328 RepID=A0A8J5H1D2_ZINOF|nr:hypothetical protein ZIOFF_025371 [Zingiber officinale]
MNPCYFFFLLLPWSLIELPLLHDRTDFHPDLLIFGTNSFYTFTLNLTIFLLVVKTTSLTMNVVGVIKDGLPLPSPGPSSVTQSPPSTSSSMTSPSSAFPTTARGLVASSPTTSIRL